MAKKKKVNTYDARHIKSLQTSVNEMSRLFDEAQNDLINLGLLSSSMARGGEFYSFSDFPELNKLVNARLKELRAESVTLLKNTERRAWDIANAKNDALVKSVAAMCGIKVEALSGCMAQNLSALSAFQTRKIGGMGLSARVWNIAKDFKTDVELALSVGMKDGASAARMTRDVKHLLKNPNALFRRVRDKATGELVPSKAMRAYHPGRGVYKSAYKNALRLTATEGNMAYRTAEHERWQSMPFVVGITIQISNNHPQPDICNDLAGTYPKDFKFVGWHPFCRCFATPKLASVSDMQKYMEDEDSEEYKPNPEDVVTEVPKGFKDWVAANSDRIAKAGEGKLPYFLRDNKWAWEGDGKSAWAAV